jgi:hypothetical protein
MIDTLAIEPGSRFYWGHAANFDYDIYNKIVERPFDNQTRFSLGGDIGLVYEFRPRFEKYLYDMDGEVGLERRDRGKYLFRVAAAVMDIRSRMRFAKGPLSNAIEITPNNLSNALHEWYLRPVKFSSFAISMTRCVGALVSPTLTRTSCADNAHPTQPQSGLAYSRSAVSRGDGHISRSARK